MLVEHKDEMSSCRMPYIERFMLKRILKELLKFLLFYIAFI